MNKDGGSPPAKNEMAGRIEAIPSDPNINLDKFLNNDIQTITFLGTTMRDYLFYNLTSLTHINMPNVTKIGTATFNSCYNLVLTELPKNIVRITNFAFSDCNSIPYLDMSEVLSIPDIYQNAFARTSFPFLFRDQAQLDSYAAATNWSALVSRFQIKGGAS